MEEKPARHDTKIAIFVIIAGLLTGGVFAYIFLRPEEAPPRYSPEFQVTDSQRIPFESDEASAAGDAAGPEAPEAGAQQDSGAEGDASVEDAPPPDDEGEADEEAGPDPRESTASERKTVDETRERMESRGVTDYAELTEDLFIRVSAKMVIMASALSHSTEEDADPAEVQGMLADNAADVLADARVDPEEFWAYTRDIHSDPERAKEMGEKILREAEKHTRWKITVEDVPGMEPTPVPEGE